MQNQSITMLSDSSSNAATEEANLVNDTDGASGGEFGPVLRFAEPVEIVAQERVNCRARVLRMQASQHQLAGASDAHTMIACAMTVAL